MPNAMSAVRPPIRRNDVLLALGLAVVHGAGATLAGVVAGGIRPVLPIVTVLLVAESLVLVLWRSRPLICQALVWTIEALIVLIVPVGYSINGLGQMVASFGIGMRLPLRRAIPLLSGLVLAELVIRRWRDPAAPWQGSAVFLLIALAIYLLPLLGGVALASSRRYDDARQELLRREHARQLEVALIQERRRLAGELHDVAAHHLAGIVVQAAAIERLVDRDPDTAKAAASQLRAQAKEALAGLRSVVGLLRRDHEEGASAPGLEHLPALVDSIRELGVDIELRADLPLPALPPQTDSAAYRVAQQAISNALQHAPGAAVRVEAQPAGEHLVLSVLNAAAQQAPGESAGGGAGLQVMRERAAAVCGQLEAGPIPQGGWRVRLVLPLDQEEDA